MSDLIDRFTSRKFLAMAFGIAVALGNAALGNITTQDALNAIVALITVFTTAEGVADAMGRTRTTSVVYPPPPAIEATATTDVVDAPPTPTP